MEITQAVRVSSTSDLKAEAHKLITHADDVRSITRQMIDLIETTENVWRGEDHTKYVNQFIGLSDDMERIYIMCNGYGERLLRIADEAYESGKTETSAKAVSLKADIELPN